jgi:hypothetical protein
MNGEGGREGGREEKKKREREREEVRGGHMLPSNIIFNGHGLKYPEREAHHSFI